MAANKSKKHNYLRSILQWTILVLILYMLLRPLFDKSYLADFEAYCPFGGMQALMSYLNADSLACSMTTVQIGLGLALLLGVLLFAKLFCSYLCPIGTVTERLGNLGRKLKLHFTVRGIPDRVLRVLKYVLLFITVYFSVTSSELFCKKFDPYYVLVSGFGSDVVIWYAIPALLLTIAGSFFIRQFWCKYLCPLGAITNIAVYGLPSAALALLWVILNRLFGGAIHWGWLLGAICATGYIFEATTLRFLIFPPLRIVRNADICTNCRICDKKCPMAIDVSTAGTINHIDCHLCTDCVVKCPEAGALTINKRLPYWIPAVITVVLTGLALLISNKYEIPTINERWATPEQMNTASVFEMDSLTSIKCFGSSRSFANHMKDVKGVLGVETYVKHHRVRVYYDQSVIGVSDIKSAIFSPVSEFFSLPGTDKPWVSVITIGVDKCFDPNDQYYLSELLNQQKGVLGLQTQFGEPVKATIYYDERSVDPEKIMQAIGQKQLILGEGADRILQTLDFRASMDAKHPDTVAVNQFLRRFFEETEITFNFFENYTPEQLDVWQIPFPQAVDVQKQDWIPYLISHASNDDGIVRLSIYFTDAGPWLRLTFVEKMTTPEKISDLLKQKEFKVHFPDGHTENVPNPFDL